MPDIPDMTITIHVLTDELDAAIEKANRLAALLEEVHDILGSLHGNSGSET